MSILLLFLKEIIKLCNDSTQLRRQLLDTAVTLFFSFTYLWYPDRLGVTGTNKLARIQRRRSVFSDYLCSHDCLGDDALGASSKEECLRPSRFPAYKVTIGLRAPRSLLSLMNLNVFLCLATPHGLTAWYGLTVQWGKRQGSATRLLSASLNAPLREEKKELLRPGYWSSKWFPPVSHCCCLLRVDEDGARKLAHTS